MLPCRDIKMLPFPLPELCESASCGEVFLLASAALANITFFDSMACEILLQLNAIHILLQACKDRQRVDTPYSKDQVPKAAETGPSTHTHADTHCLLIFFIFASLQLQVVTILANLSVLESCASEVLQEQGNQIYCCVFSYFLFLLPCFCFFCYCRPGPQTNFINES